MNHQIAAVYDTAADEDAPPWWALCTCGWERGPYTSEEIAWTVVNAHWRNATDANY